jgi:hypothetical protein
MKHSDERLFWSKVVEDPSGCWLWTGTTQYGYGKFRPARVGGVQQGLVRAHRWAYESMVAEIPDGLALDHLCRRKNCVNPWHLDPVTWGVNNARRPALVGRTVTLSPRCKWGHEFDEENTRIYRGHRVCRACEAAKTRAKRARRRLMVISS